MSMFDLMTPEGYEQVLFCHDRGSGLRSIIVIHDTTLGPALGGVRMRPYATEEEALEDCLRLARAMTYKNASAGLHLGGAKSVIIGDPATEKTEALIRAHGRFIKSLGGRYIPGLDVGTEPEDMRLMAREGARVTCETGDPSIFTGKGVVASIRAALEFLDGDGDLTGRTVTVQGVGHAGKWVVRLLREAGAHVLLADIDADLAARMASETGAEIVAPEDIVSTPADVFAPCALGDVVNPDTIGALKVRAVCGAANNPLAPGMAEALRDAGILFVPDFMSNSAGVTRLEDILNGRDEAFTDERVDQLGRTILGVLRRADAEGRTTVAVGESLAEERIAAMRALGPAFA
jgi:leucine dehydrogenase